MARIKKVDNMALFGLIKDKKIIEQPKNDIVIPTEPMNVVRMDDGNIKTENVVKDAGALRTFVGSIATQQNNKDVITNSQYTYSTRILEQYLENAYQESWLAKRLVELPVEMAMQNGFNLTLKNKDDEKKFWYAWKKFKLNDLIIDTQKWADVYGSCIILLKNKNEDPEKPYKNFKDLEFVQVQYPFYMPLPNSNDVYETDRVSCNLLGVTADLSNVAVFYGAKCIKRLSPQFKYFGMSVYQNMWKAMISDELITTAVANLIYRSSTPVYKMKGFNQLVDAGKQNLVLDALSTSELSRGIFGALVLDSENSFEMVSQSMTQLADIDRRSAERVCGAVGYPATMILGKSPDGQNATGKHDEKNTIIAIQRYQSKMLPGVKTVSLALIRHLEIDETDWDIEFNNPHSQDNEEAAKTEGLQLDNALKLQTVTGSQEIVNRYLKDTQLINEEEHQELDKLKAEFDETNRLENEKGEVPTDKNAE